MKIIADDLEAAGEFVHETNFAYYILGGLGPEFDPVSENLNSQLDSIGLTEVRSRLLAYESKLEDYNFALSMNLGHSHSANMISSVSHTGLNSVNLVQPPTHGHVETSGRNFQFSGSNINVGRGFSPRAQFDRGFVGNYNYRNENYNTRGRGFFGRGRGTNRPICQVCKMVGHTGDVCYYRYAQLFQQSVPQPSFTVGSANPWTFFAGVPHTLPHTLQSGFSDNFLYNYNMRSPIMPESTIGMVAPNLQSYGSMSGLSNPFSYGVSTPLGSSNNISGQVPQQSTGFCVHNGVPHFGAPLSASIGMNSAGYPFMPPMSANVVSATVDPNPSWFLDSGATNHVAADGDSLLEHIEFQGNNKLTVGNGQNVDITHIGNSFIPSISMVVRLNNVLVVPCIAKNLLSIS
nr:uncharacterized protein LOC125422453 isoform X1 [Ziziphus jujuba var. spinosa]